jgi:flagellar biosynthetic protein FliQ
MNPDMVIHYGKEALEMILMLSLPMLMVALVVGVVISLFQAVTQIQEMTLTFVPKIIAVFVAIVVAAPWMVETLVSYTHRLFESIPTLLS